MSVIGTHLYPSVVSNYDTSVLDPQYLPMSYRLLQGRLHLHVLELTDGEVQVLQKQLGMQ